MQQQTKRSGIIVGFISLGLIAMTALTISLAQAATGTGPYYAPPAWDRTLQATTRFVILKNMNSQAVLDKETGLVWERSPATNFDNWIGALAVCTTRTTGNRKGWRLPSMPELASLVDPSVTSGPTLPLGHPFSTVQSGGYWSATTQAAGPTFAWAVTFFDGDLAAIAKDMNLARPWCVRGAMNTDAY